MNNGDIINHLTRDTIRDEYNKCFVKFIRNTLCM